MFQLLVKYCNIDIIDKIIKNDHNGVNVNQFIQKANMGSHKRIELHGRFYQFNYYNNHVTCVRKLVKKRPRVDRRNQSVSIVAN